MYLFIENDELRLANLKQEVDRLPLPNNIAVDARLGQFDEAMSEILDVLGVTGQRLAPTFAFIDPFGVSQTPFSIIQQLLANSHCEVLINFMYSTITRFLNHPDHILTWTRLFGTDAWRPLVAIRDPDIRRQAIHDLYARQLKIAAKARFVRSFEMRDDHNAPIYFLFFATNSAKGLEKMKEAMWKVDPSGAFRFSDATVTDQLVLFGPEPDYHFLRRQLEHQFQERVVGIEEIESFVIEETAFLRTHFRQRVLAAMERAAPPTITVVSAPPGRRRGTYPPGTKLHFGSQERLV